MKMPGSISVNEYEVLKEIRENSSYELKAKGYSHEMINKFKAIKDEDIYENLKEHAQLDENELKIMGLSDEQIAYVKNPETWTNTTLSDLPEDIIMALSASLSMWAETGFYDRNSLHATYSVFWAWSARPHSRFTDCIGSSFVNSYSASSASTGIVAYVDENNWGNPVVVRYPVLRYPNAGVSMTFPMNHYTSTGPQWGKNGKMFVDITGVAAPQSILTLSAYGHSRIALNPSISFNLSGDLGFSFNPAINIITMNQINHDIW